MPEPGDVPTLADELEPWEMQPGESPLGYANFCQYRDLGPRRGLRQIARKVSRDGETIVIQPGLASLARITLWSSHWRWVERAHAWDAHLERARRDAQLDENREMATRHMNLAMHGLNVVARRLLGDAATGVEALDPASLKPADVVRAMEVFQKLERLARGEPDTIARHEGPDGGLMRVQATSTDGELLENMRVLEECGAMPAGTAAAIGVVLGVATAANGDDDDRA